MELDDLREDSRRDSGYRPRMPALLDEALVGRSRRSRELTGATSSSPRGEVIGWAAAPTRPKSAPSLRRTSGTSGRRYLCAKDRKLEVFDNQASYGPRPPRHSEPKSASRRSARISRRSSRWPGGAGFGAHLLSASTAPGPLLPEGCHGARRPEVGPTLGSSLISYEAVDNGAHSDPNIVAKVLTNDDTRRETEEILKLHKDQVTDLLHKNKHLVEALRDALLEREELIGDEIMTVIEKAEIADEASGPGNAS